MIERRGRTDSLLSLLVSRDQSGPGSSKLFWLGLLTFCIQLDRTSAASGSIYCFKGKDLELIDSERFICCDGKLDKFDNHGMPQECCQIDRTDENGRVTPTRVAYNTKKKLCCGGRLYDLPKNHSFLHPKCCGTDILVDEVNNFCCQNKTYQRSSPFDDCYKISTEKFSVEFPVGPNEIVCKNWTKNGTIDQWKVHIHTDGWECCGTELHNDNNKTHFCSHDRIWPQSAIVSECGGISYDKNEYACCNDEWKIPINKSGKHNAKYLDISPDYSCFDGKLIDNDLERIVQTANVNIVIPNNHLPCGNLYFDPHNKRKRVACCNGIVNYANLNMNVTCCGNEFIDTSKHMCCNDTKILVTSNRKCCGDKSYDRTSGLECCGSQLMGKSHLCCHPQSSISIPIRKGHGHNQCCGNQTYNILEKHCCAGVPKILKANQTCSSHSGRIIDIARIISGDVKEIIKNNPSKRDNGGMMTDKLEPDCPACTKSREPSNDCVKKFEFRVYIKNVKKGKTSTSLEVLVLDPLIQMVLRTSGNCRCFKKDDLYWFYTNRNLLDKIKKSRKFRLRFTKKDIFRVISGKYPKYSEKKCRVDRYLKKPIVS